MNCSFFYLVVTCNLLSLFKQAVLCKIYVQKHLAGLRQFLIHFGPSWQCKHKQKRSHGVYMKSSSVTSWTVSNCLVRKCQTLIKSNCFLGDPACANTGGKEDTSKTPVITFFFYVPLILNHHGVEPFCMVLALVGVSKWAMDKLMELVNGSSWHSRSVGL